MVVLIHLHAVCSCIYTTMAELTSRLTKLQHLLPAPFQKTMLPPALAHSIAPGCFSFLRGSQSTASQGGESKLQRRSSWSCAVLSYILHIDTILVQLITVDTKTK